MSSKTTKLSDYTRLGKGGPIVRCDAVVAIIPAQIGRQSLVCVAGAPQMDIPMKADDVFDAIVDGGSLELSDEEAQSLGFPKSETSPSPILTPGDPRLNGEG